MSWQDWPRAPAPGTVLCAASEVGRWRSVEVGGFGVLIVGGGDGGAGGGEAAAPRAFVNLCPHQFLPLDWQGGNVLSADGSRLVCSQHQACFDAATGALLSGPAEEGLEPVPVVVDADGMLRIAGG